MSQRDWDKVRRQDVVGRKGSERSEFRDLTEQYAKAKGQSKIRGPFMKACVRCGLYYPEGDYDEHVLSCRPPKSEIVKCPICGKAVDSTRLRTHMNFYHPKPGWPNPPPKGIAVKCRFCHKKVKLRGLKDHNKMWHGGK